MGDGGWTRKDIVETIISAISAIATATAAIFAYSAVNAANSQVKVAIDAVNRTEKLKNLSEYSTAAHGICRAMVPSEMKDRIHGAILGKGASTLPPEIRYHMDSIDDLNEDQLKKISTSNQKALNEARSNADSKAGALAIWIDDEITRNELVEFTSRLQSHVEFKSDDPKYSFNNKIATSYGLCESLVDAKTKEILKQ